LPAALVRSTPPNAKQWTLDVHVPAELIQIADNPNLVRLNF